MPDSMSILKKLAGQTAIYGLTGMIGRFLFFLLTPIYTNQAVFDQAQFGQITELYAYMVFVMLIITFSMETSFFRYSTIDGNSKKSVFATALVTVATLSGIFLASTWIFTDQIATWTKFEANPEYIKWLGAILAMDAVSAIAMTKLRSQERAGRFAFINLTSVIANIGLILFFLVYCGMNYENNSNALIDAVYNPEIGIAYVFIANMIASGIKILLLIPEFSFGGFKFNMTLFRQMMPYAIPLVIFGFAGSINEVIDRIMLKEIVYDSGMAKGLSHDSALEAAQVQNGIYGAVYKISMIIIIFLQAYRFAAEPFFFNREKEKNSKLMYSRIMTFFVIAVAVMFLVVVLYLHVFKYFIGESYWQGLSVVPILLLANFSLGIYWNLNMWFKLTKKTNFGAYMAGIGAVITIVGNYIFIPVYGYEACAWVTFVTYVSLTVLSYFLGQKHYPIPYNLRKVFLYIGLAVLIYFISSPFDPEESFTGLMWLYHTGLLLAYIAIVLFIERPKKLIPSKDVID
jgi:O-antigen/teichoic acid export membrane protein